MGKEEPHVLDIVGPEELSTSDRMFLTLAAFKNTIGYNWFVIGVMLGIILISLFMITYAPETTGVRVLYVIDGLGADDAGIMVNDVIIAVGLYQGDENMEKIKISNAGNFPEFLIGETVEVIIERGEKQLMIPVEVLPDPEDDSRPMSQTGMLGVVNDQTGYSLQIAWYSIISLLGLVIVMIIWLQLRGKKWSGTADILRRQHRMESYFSTLSLATRETDDISLDFFNIAVDVFPELKQHESKINQESGEIELESMTLEKKNNYKFDVWEDTKEGTFLIKSFPHNAPKMKVTYEQIEKAAELAKDEPDNCLRLVCLGDAFESKAVEEISKIEDKMEFKVPIDLILGNSIGFSAVRISPLNPE